MSPDDVINAFQALTGDEVVSVERLPGGSSDPTWQVDTEQGRYAVKLYPEHLGATAQGQAQLLRYLTEQTYPAPKLYTYGNHQTN